MTELTIKDEDLAGVKDSIVVITGASSGIGLATAKLLLELGAKVIGGDINPPKDGFDHVDFTYVRTDVTSWGDVLMLFEAGISKYGRIDHTFANAGIGRYEHYLDDILDESGKLADPGHPVLEINSIGLFNTVKVGIHHMRKTEKLGTVVVTASAAGFVGINNVEYGMSKFAAVAMVRDLAAELHPKMPVRINGLAPFWTETSLVTKESAETLNVTLQPASAVARSAVLLMSDEKRHNEIIYSQHSKFYEVNKPVIKSILAQLPAMNLENDGMNRLQEMEKLGQSIA